MEASEIWTNTVHLHVDGIHMGGGGQAPASAAASMAPGGGAHAISSSPLKKIE